VKNFPALVTIENNFDLIKQQLRNARKEYTSSMFPG
jgi:hypothetical protein